MSFEWQTEEESSWEETVATDTEPQRPSRSSWMWIALLLAVAGAGLYFGWRTVQDRVDQATELVEEDVRSSHALARQAARQKDEELFVTLLSGRVASWTEAQKERLRRGLLYGDAGRLFSLQQTAASTNGEVTLNADLTEAVLTAAEPFVVDAGDGITQTVVMTQTAVYRKGNHRWLLSPPTADFWGEQQTLAGEMLMIVYPERDEAIAQRLAQDIDDALREMCLTFVTCPPRLTVRLQLDTDPESIISAADARIYLRGGNELTLPSPTLVGLPVDEEAYQALLRGYASYVAALVLVETADYDCCEQARFQQAIVNLQLAELGLRPEPVDTIDYIDLVDNPPDLQRLRTWWNLSDPADLVDTLDSDISGVEGSLFSQVELYSFIRYLQNAGEAAPVSLRDMQHALSQETSFWAWVGAITGYGSFAQDRVEREWLFYINKWVREAQEAISLPDELSLPEQDIIALCSREQGLDVQRLDLQTGQWETELALGIQFGVLAALPDDDRYLLTAELPQLAREEVIRSWLGQPGQEPLLIGGNDVDNAVILPWTVTDPTGESFFGWRSDPQGTESPEAVLVDPDNCSESGCEYDSVPGLPRWSPDQKSTIYIGMAEPVLYLQRPGESSYVELGEGQQPFWLDNETFAYMKWVPNLNAQTLVVATLENPEPQELLSTEMLGGLVPEAGSNRLGMSLYWIDRDPYDENRILFIAAAPTGQGSSHLFELTRSDSSVAWPESEVEVRWLDSFVGQPLDGWFYQAPVVAEGRWLVLPLARIRQSPGSGPSNGWMLYDLRDKKLLLTSFTSSNENFLTAAADLSADGQWFVRSIPGAMELVAPTYLVDQQPFRYFIPHGFDQCQSAAWINGP